MNVRSPSGLSSWAALMCALVLCMLSAMLIAQDAKVGFFEHNPVPGGIAIVDLQLPDTNDQPHVKLGDREIAVLAQNGKWYAIVGIALSVEPGKHTLAVDATGDLSEISFEVNEFKYEEQRIVLKDDRKVNPAPLDMERIKKENVRIAAVKAYRHETLLSDGFQLPLEGILTSPFGLRRFFNDQPRRPHGGIDIAADTGTPIHAPADGLVVDTGNYFFNGNSIFLAHGLGLQTFYAHMSKMHVETGDKVKAGDLIGEVGETGRVTGPHLHWSVGLNGTWVDPRLVMSE